MCMVCICISDSTDDTYSRLQIDSKQSVHEPVMLMWHIKIASKKFPVLHSTLFTVHFTYGSC